MNVFCYGLFKHKLWIMLDMGVSFGQPMSMKEKEEFM